MKFSPLPVARCCSSLLAILVAVQLTDAFQQPTGRLSTNLGPRINTVTSSMEELGRVASVPTQLSLGKSGMLLADAAGSSDLQTYFLQTLIANGVPAVLSIAVIAFAAIAFRRRPNDNDFGFDNNRSPAAELYRDLYGDQMQKSGGSSQGFLARFMGGKSSGIELPQNVGVPSQQYIRMTNLNRKLDSYQYSVTAATQSTSLAAANYRKTSFQRALRKSLVKLTPSQWAELESIEGDFLKEGAAIVEDVQKLQTKLTQIVVDNEMESLGMENAYQLDAPVPENKTDASGSKEKSKSPASKTKLQGQLAKLQSELQTLELDFIADVVQCVGPANAAAVRTALLGDVAVRAGIGGGRLLLDLQERPLTALLASSAEETAANASKTATIIDPEAHGNEKISSTTSLSRTPRLYVTRFPGDATASQVATLREEVTAIVRNAVPGVDEALVILQTGGGTVTGYGLAASQLKRFKANNIKLTIAVEQVAASGGYMMCCVADRIVASPFAVLGSIGVISDIPNVYERLKREGIEFQTVTAGKYKRTLTPTKKVTKEDMEKSKEDVEDILVLFRDFVAANRPQLDIDKVATGETWFGQDALDRKLCDEIQPVDDVLMEYVDKGFDVFEIEYEEPVELPFGSLIPGRASEGTLVRSMAGAEPSGIFAKAIRWIVRTISAEVQAEISRQTVYSSEDSAITSATRVPPIEERYMAMNKDSDRIRAEV